MLARFLQLFMLASIVLLLPTLFYLSRQHQEYSVSKDYSFMQTHSWQEHPELQQHLEQQQKAKESSQGNGAPPALDPHVAQSWRFIDYLHGFGSGHREQEKALPSPSPSPPAPGMKEDVPVSPGVIMPKMVNATAKAELGRATWRFLHTMTLRFPEKPTQDDKDTLLRFLHDFARLYPCGECASHFQQLLTELPPQVGTRMNAALWLCSAHNRVNARLGKEDFPCDKLDETYDCGCGEETEEQQTDAADSPTTQSAIHAPPSS